MDKIFMLFFLIGMFWTLLDLFLKPNNKNGKFHLAYEVFVVLLGIGPALTGDGLFLFTEIILAIDIVNGMFLFFYDKKYNIIELVNDNPLKIVSHPKIATIFLIAVVGLLCSIALFTSAILMIGSLF